jgi:catechol 2,3-dioxygenase-like lactoylglutathione lyase family enzyme
MIDHVDIRVSDFDASRAFYEAVLEPLGYRAGSEVADPSGGRELGFRAGGRVEFAIHTPAPAPGQDSITSGAHVAFIAATRDAVGRFHAAALEHGGRNIGDPGLRPEYSPGYYGAFALDPDGNNVEAVLKED